MSEIKIHKKKKRKKKQIKKTKPSKEKRKEIISVYEGEKITILTVWFGKIQRRQTNNKRRRSVYLRFFERNKKKTYFSFKFLRSVYNIISTSRENIF